MPYASIMSRETVTIALTLDELNNISVKVADIKNAYITSPVTETIWKVLGPDFGEDDGSKSIVVRTFYGLNISGSKFCNHLSDCMHNLVFLTCPSDLDIWMKTMVRPDEGFNYYTYI